LRGSMRSMRDEHMVHVHENASGAW